MRANVGADLTNVEDVRESIAVFGRHYLERIYTETELAETDLAPELLAARFAAKEATIKALGCGEGGWGWRTIAVARGVDGQLRIELSGPAAEHAQRRGLQSIAVSLTHEGEYAAAVVMVESER
jgi:holo-[acyl-carrier protein] synthase